MMNLYVALIIFFDLKRVYFTNLKHAKIVLQILIFLCIFVERSWNRV